MMERLRRPTAGGTRRQGGSGFLCFAVGLVAVLLSSVEAARLRRLTGLRSAFGQPMEMTSNPGPLEIPDCACTCCQITVRKPAEIIDPTITLKCMLDEGSQANCPAKCTVKHNPVLRTELPSDIENGLDYNRYCFFQCQPKTDKISGPCGPLDKKDTKKAVSADGNGADANLPPDMPGISPRPDDFLPPGSKSGKGVECKKDPCQYKTIERIRTEAKALYGEAKVLSAGARAAAKAAPR